jgi:hypothetical protein
MKHVNPAAFENQKVRWTYPVWPSYCASVENKLGTLLRELGYYRIEACQRGAAIDDIGLKAVDEPSEAEKGRWIKAAFHGEKVRFRRRRDAMTRIGRF